MRLENRWWRGIQNISRRTLKGYQIMHIKDIGAQKGKVVVYTENFTKNMRLHVWDFGANNGKGVGDWVMEGIS